MSIWKHSVSRETLLEEETEMCESIMIKYVRGVDKIELVSEGDWVDLRCALDVKLSKGEFKLIPLGVCMKLALGYEALLIPRSSTFIKYGILQTNGVGLIDESYCGEDDEWKFPAYATRDIEIPKNSRIAQFRIVKHQPTIVFNEVKYMLDNSRGGFGSTGN